MVRLTRRAMLKMAGAVAAGVVCLPAISRASNALLAPEQFGKEGAALWDQVVKVRAAMDAAPISDAPGTTRYVFDRQQNAWIGVTL